MSGHAGYAAALAQFQTDPFRQITATVTPSTSTLREILPLGPGRGVFSLDKSLSWKSHGGGDDIRHEIEAPYRVEDLVELLVGIAIHPQLVFDLGIDEKPQGIR